MRPAGTRRRPQLSRAASTRAEAPARTEISSTSGSSFAPGPSSASWPSTPSRTASGARVSSDTGQRNRNPQLIGYLMAVAALPILLALRHFGLVAKVPIWLYAAVFIASPVSSLLTDRFTEKHTGPAAVNLRVAAHVASVTAVIYMSGWGPEIVGAYGFVLVDNLARSGAKTWRAVSLWTVLGVATGQLFVSRGWAPSFLPTSRANALAFLGTVVVLFIARMLGATTEQKETAESALRSSEERFRSLVQHSYDTMIVTSEDGSINFASPSVKALIGRTPDEVVGVQSTSFIHPEERERVRLSSSRALPAGKSPSASSSGWLIRTEPGGTSRQS